MKNSGFCGISNLIGFNEPSAPRASIAKSRSRCDELTFELVSAMPRGPKMCSCKYFSSRSPLTFSTILLAKSKRSGAGLAWKGLRRSSVPRSTL